MDSRETILIVEDSHEIRVLLREYLEDEGFRVLSEPNGKNALDALTNGARPSIIFLDINMPIMNGYEFLKILRATSDLSRIPVVVMTATTDTSDLHLADHFLRKPFDLDAVLRLANHYCRLAAEKIE